MLKRLGYLAGSDHVKFRGSHCISNCPAGTKMYRDDRPGGFAHVETAGSSGGNDVKPAKPRDWYDADSAGAVAELYARDFEAFGWSTDPTKMWD